MTRFGYLRGLVQGVVEACAGYFMGIVRENFGYRVWIFWLSFRKFAGSPLVKYWDLA